MEVFAACNDKLFWGILLTESAIKTIRSRAVLSPSYLTM
jgi:hypothetical protein